MLPLQGVMRIDCRIPRALPWAMIYWPFRPDKKGEFVNGCSSTQGVALGYDILAFQAGQKKENL